MLRIDMNTADTHTGGISSHFHMNNGRKARNQT